MNSSATQPRKKPLIAGNWKMNGISADLGELQAIAAADVRGVDVLVCPPATLLSDAARALKGTSLLLGGQDCHELEKGAYTGDVSAEMLRDAGATFVILGHSERRTYHHENNAHIALKADAAVAAGLIPIICVGETLKQREAGEAMEFVEEQLAGSLPDGNAALVLAYEPVWAIGTGKVASIADITQMHLFIHQWLQAKHPGHAAIRVLYGGSVKASNASEIFAVPHVDGALVGGASLKAAAFLPIVMAAKK